MPTEAAIPASASRSVYFDRCVLRSSIAYVPQHVPGLTRLAAGSRSPARERRGPAAWSSMVPAPPAQDPPGVGVDDERDVHPPGPGRDVGDVGDPQAVRGRRGEPALHQVTGPLRGGSAIVVRLTLPRHGAGQPGVAHQPLHRAAGHRRCLRGSAAATPSARRRRRSSPRAPGGSRLLQLLVAAAERVAAPVGGVRSTSTGRSADPCSVSTAQIGSTPHRRPPPSRRSACSRMNSAISGRAGRARPRRKPTPPSRSRWRA